jgi:multidrug efflux system outer membrane protein
VASTYFQLLELDQELEVARQSLVSRRDSARLVEARMTGGISNKLELDQAKSLVFSAEATITMLNGGRADRKSPEHIDRRQP